MSDDDQLMVRIQEGDREAFAELVERFQGPLFGFFLRNTRDAHASEDLAQETLLRVHSQAWDYLPQGKFRGWMFRIARNLLIDSVRRQSSDALVHAFKGTTGEDADAMARIADEVLPPDERADYRELAELVEEMLGEIPEEQRLTFTLHHFAGLSLGEVAEVLETNLATSKSRLRLAREKLQERLRPFGVVAPGEERR